MNPLRAVKGMNDVLPSDIARWHMIEHAFRETMERAGFREVRTPYVEPTPLFVRTIGEATDVVEKEMYSFRHHDEPLTLRPEGTAGAARAYVEHKAHASEPVSKWYYIGPMFRAERPQRGRYRQFHQAGAEIFGDKGPAADAEMIDLLVGFLRSIGVSDPEVLVNSIGGPETRARYREAIVAALTPKSESLSEESKRRLSTNPLRILDSKDPRDKEATATLPALIDFLSDDDRNHFDALQRHLNALGTPFRVDPTLVRGLDYYTRTLFEIKGAKEILGAGDTLLGGGRYDGMVEELGGPSVPAIGFAAGLERLLLASTKSAPSTSADVFVATMGEKAESAGLAIAKELRGNGFNVEVDARGASLKAQLRRANSVEATFALVIGDREVEEGVFELKHLPSHTAVRVARSDLRARIDEIRANPPPAAEGAT